MLLAESLLTMQVVVVVAHLHQDQVDLDNLAVARVV
jgi:hypothetical protein